MTMQSDTILFDRFSRPNGRSRMNGLGRLYYTNLLSQKGLSAWLENQYSNPSILSGLEH